MLKKIIPLLLILAAFAYFTTRDRASFRPQEPEDALISMVLAVSSGNVANFVDCFGGDLRNRLQAIVEKEGESAFSTRLQERARLVKGFAILKKEPRGSTALLVNTETVYEDKNTAQTFLLEPQGGKWKIVQSDSEIVADWDTDFGKPIWETQ